MGVDIVLSDISMHQADQENVDIKLQQSIFDLSRRWLRCRLSALRNLNFESEDVLFEQIQELSDDKYEELLKSIFLNSRNLGVSYQKQFGLVWERSDFARYLSSLDSPCTMGKWESRSSSEVLTRSGCVQGKQYGSRYCRFWREAIDGLVTGLGDDTGYMRHSSVAAGDDNCTDVFYQDEAIPTDALWRNEMRWGPLSEELKAKLLPVEKNSSG